MATDRRIVRGLSALGRCSKGRCRRNCGTSGSQVRCGSVTAVTGLLVNLTNGPVLCISHGIPMAGRFNLRLKDAGCNNPNYPASIAAGLTAESGEDGGRGHGPNGGTC